MSQPLTKIPEKTLQKTVDFGELGLATTIEKLRDSFEELEEAPNPVFKYRMRLENYDHYLNENNKFNPILLADDVLRCYHFRTDKKTQTMYVYDEEKGIYTDNGEVAIQEMLTEVLGEETRQRYFKEIVFYIQGRTFFQPSDYQTLKVALENGLLNPETQEMERFSSSAFVTTQLPVSYNPAAKCPKILQFLKEVLGENQLLVAQEFIGYCLYQKMIFQKALLLIGSGSNGKSTFNELLKTFLGPENCSNQTLQEICNNRFATAILYNKLANICADLPSNKITHSGMFKMVVGNDTIKAEHKFQKPFSFVNTSKMVFSANELPPVSNNNDNFAFFRRWKILRFDKTFVGPNCDHNLLEKITTPEELSGLLNWALKGLNRLLTNKRFSINEKVEEMRKQYIKRSDSAKAFIEEVLEESNESTDFITVKDLYQRFLKYCHQEKIKTMSKRALTIKMQEHLPEVNQTKQRINGKPNMVWQYIRMKSVPTVPTHSTL